MACQSIAKRPATSVVLSILRKDRTLVEILDRLKKLEGKVDLIPTRGGQSTTSCDPPRLSPARNPTFTNSELQFFYSAPSQQSGCDATKTSHPYKHTRAAHKILSWPAIQQILLQFLPANIEDINDYERDGVRFLVGVSQSHAPLPLDDGLRMLPFPNMVCIYLVDLLN